MEEVKEWLKTFEPPRGMQDHCVEHEKYNIFNACPGLKCYVPMEKYDECSMDYELNPLGKNGLKTTGANAMLAAPSFMVWKKGSLTSFLNPYSIHFSQSSVSNNNIMSSHYPSRPNMTNDLYSEVLGVMEPYSISGQWDESSNKFDFNEENEPIKSNHKSITELMDSLNLSDFEKDGVEPKSQIGIDKYFESIQENSKSLFDQYKIRTENMKLLRKRAYCV
ncbi:hypothetical protein A3Q56_02753 [Intoshia linei]|uniref:Uncharacterized protein n=1 Tax=Intoshia linei TaxID=1819745 RepID=A0A177B7V3_9BILA|nr:hypothetical protein A3Q56_02753 [Intoshia linei]